MADADGRAGRGAELLRNDRMLHIVNKSPPQTHRARTAACAWPGRRSAAADRGRASTPPPSGAAAAAASREAHEAAARSTRCSPTSRRAAWPAG
ncbi:MAG: hypothetical protein MZV65_33035 [Chromatiales bacterium]|nr:hypothetical protein [Chromatiales bacterium]